MAELRSKYQATKDRPSHLSVGCVLLNDQDQVALHHFAKTPIGDDVYLLMRETLNDNETLERGVARGLKEEMGMEANIIQFLTSLHVLLPAGTGASYVMSKTTLYFLARLTAVGARDPNDQEASSTIVWLPLPEATSLILKQTMRFPDRPDLDEAGVLFETRRVLGEDL